MKPRTGLVVAAAMALVASYAVPASAAPSASLASASFAKSFTHLRPGGQPRLTERVPVNVVFVGYEPGQVRKDAFLSGLPRRYEPVVRSRLLYDITEKLGITYTYDYRVRYTDRAYEDRFFRQLGRLATPAPLTQYQTQYNEQNGNVLDVTDNHFIDAPSVERWLASNPPAGVDTRRNTVFFINWYGRSDFKFHVYTKTNEPDPDTGYNFGVERESRKIIAWGGTTADDEENGLGKTRRVWFHDLSAGPESWTENWNVDDPDLDGNGVEDYRMPPIWEYRADGYRAASALTGDLSKITRYVAINLLFTTSPLYPPELPTRTPPRSINLDNNTYEGWPGVDASATYVKPRLLVDELSELRWRNRLDYDNQDLPYAGDAERCYVLQLAEEPCLPGQTLPSDANLFLQNLRDFERTRDDVGRVDYELPMFSYAVDEGVGSPALGYADDNWTDGTQSYVFNFVSPEIVESGYGLTTTMIHEVGHHLGMPHPHDGYDSATGVDYEPADEFFFAWAGDEHNSMMSYIDLNWDFSQFDRDNSDRYLTAVYNEAANKLAAAVLADRDVHRARANLRAADRLIGLAKAALAQHSYRVAYTAADLAFQQVAAGAKLAGVPVDAAAQRSAAPLSARTANRPDAPGHGPHEFVDTLGPETPRSDP